MTPEPIEVKLARMEEQMKGLEQTVLATNKLIGQHIKDSKDEQLRARQSLFGNGSMGLLSKVEIMWKAGAFVIVTIVAQAVALVFNLMK